MTDFENASDHRTNSRQGGGLLQMVPGLNALRVTATLLVLLAHAGIPYMATPVRTTLWLLHDSTQHISVDCLLLWVNGFAMPLFFLMAGISASQAGTNASWGEFAWLRFRRLASPFLLTFFCILPFAYVAWGIGFLYSERAPISQLLRLRFAPELQQHLIGPFHLWFLIYLFLISVGWCGLMKLANRLLPNNETRTTTFLASFFASPLRPFWFALPTMVVFCCDVETPFRLPNAFLPDVTRVLHYVLFFAAGFWLARQSRPLLLVQSNWPWFLALATLIYVGLFPLTMRFLAGSLTGKEQLLLAVLQALFAWLMVFGSLGWFCSLFSGRNAVVRYLNEASFWIYLAHLPLVAIGQLLVWSLPWNFVVKIVAVSAFTLALSLLIYQYGVRYSVLGALISGSRKKINGVAGWRLEAGWIGSLAVVAVGVGLFLYTHREMFSGENIHPLAAGKYYRCNRLSAERLVTVMDQLGIQAVISVAPAAPTDPWWIEQQAICQSRGVPIRALKFYDEEPPLWWQIEELNQALKDLPRPILIEGNARTPTLAGMGGALALLHEGESLEVALQQLSWKYCQIEGPEHCIIAKPLLVYRDWLTNTNQPHNIDLFRKWCVTEQVEMNLRVERQAKASENVWQHQIGAPRFPRWR